MDDFLKMDIFFAVTTAVVLLFGVFSCVVLFYIIKILRNATHVMDNVSEESDILREDIAVLRENIHEEGLKVKHIVEFWGNVAAPGKAGAKPKPKGKQKTTVEK